MLGHQCRSCVFATILVMLVEMPRLCEESDDVGMSMCVFSFVSVGISNPQREVCLHQNNGT